MMAENAGQLLFVMLLGLLLAFCWHWSRSPRQLTLGFLIVLVVFSLGRELVQEIAGGLSGWQPWHIALAGWMRLGMVGAICGAIWSVTSDRCGHKAWLGWLGVGLLYMWVR